MVKIYILAYKNQSRVDRLVKSIPEQYAEDTLIVNNGPTEITGRSVLQGPGGGFTPGFNFCLRHCRSEFPEAIPVILNDDLELEENTIEKMIEPILNDPRVGIVAPMQVQMDNPAMVICGGFGAAYPSGQHRTGLVGDPEIKYSNPRWVTFCAVAINPLLVNEIGYLDNWMSMYYSDSDYSYRATLAGFTLVFNPESVVRHENHGATSEFLTESATRILLMDKWYFETKWGERVRTHLS